VSTLTITRTRKGFADRNRRYRILLDGREVARLKPGESWSTDLAPGSHDSEARLDFTRSPKVDVSGDGATTKLELEPRYALGDPRILIHPHRYLDLRRSASD
jgi:hypothetical protein